MEDQNKRQKKTRTLNMYKLSGKRILYAYDGGEMVAGVDPYDSDKRFWFLPDYNNVIIDLAQEIKTGIRKYIICTSGNSDLTNPVDETAYFYQLKKTIYPDADTGIDSDCLKYKIVELDFDKNLFGNKLEDEGLTDETESRYNDQLGYPYELGVTAKVPDEERMKYIFNHGIQIRFEEDKAPITFIPLDKSASMARKSRMYFIDSSVLNIFHESATLEDRLNLGYDFPNIAKQKSKYYAYRGLFLSSATRIEQTEDLVLNEETVIVIDDEAEILKYETTKLSYITNKKEPDEDNKNKDENTDKIVIDKPFDGEGLISPTYAALINKQLQDNEQFQKDIASFQIRLPYTKGMLHTVNYQAFLHEVLQDRSEEYIIEDYLGIKRDLKKAHIILTKSMFKAADWLKELYDEPVDPMRDFFQRMNRFDHTLYISGNDLPYTGRKLVSLNYQILNTLLLRREELQALVDQHTSNVEEEKIAQYIVRKNSMVDIDPKNNKVGPLKKVPSWVAALNKEPALIHNPYIRGKLRGSVYKNINDIALGNIETDGEIRIFSRDIMFLLRYLITMILGDPLPDDIKEKIDPELLDVDEFDMPSNNIELEDKYHYPIFRNPHLSRNEESALRFRACGLDTLRGKYFGKLRGVLMISRKSFDHEILGGADFDGDIVRIVDNDIIRDAVLRGAYGMRINDQYKLESSYERTLPIVRITAMKPKKNDAPNDQETQPEGYWYDPDSEEAQYDLDRWLEELEQIEEDSYDPYELSEIPDDQDMQLEEDLYDTSSPTVDYKTIFHTFSNKVGLISNLSIQQGEREYNGREFKGAYKAWDNLNVSCAACTIYTGLEIDAAKTGFHPDIPSFDAVGSTVVIPHDQVLCIHSDFIRDYKEKNKEIEEKIVLIISNLIIKKSKDYKEKNKEIEEKIVLIIPNLSKEENKEENKEESKEENKEESKEENKEEFSIEKEIQELIEKYSAELVDKPESFDQKTDYCYFLLSDKKIKEKIKEIIRDNLNLTSFDYVHSFMNPMKAIIGKTSCGNPLEFGNEEDDGNGNTKYEVTYKDKDRGYTPNTESVYIRSKSDQDENPLLMITNIYKEKYEHYKIFFDSSKKEKTKTKTVNPLSDYTFLKSPASDSDFDSKIQAEIEETAQDYKSLKSFVTAYGKTTSDFKEEKNTSEYFIRRILSVQKKNYYEYDVPSLIASFHAHSDGREGSIIDSIGGAIDRLKESDWIYLPDEEEYTDLRKKELKRILGFEADDVFYEFVSDFSYKGIDLLYLYLKSAKYCHLVEAKSSKQYCLDKVIKEDKEGKKGYKELYERRKDVLNKIISPDKSQTDLLNSLTSKITHMILNKFEPEKNDEPENDKPENDKPKKVKSEKVNLSSQLRIMYQATKGASEELFWEYFTAEDIKEGLEKEVK